MKKMLKRLSIALMMLVLVMGMTGCASETVADENALDASVVSQMEMYCISALDSLAPLTDADIENYLASGDDFTIAAMNAWLDNREELGAYQQILSSEAVMEEEMYILTSDVAFENRNATVVMNFDATGMPTYITMEVQYSLGELMGQAGMNTLMGVGIVFLVLLFLSLLIGTFKYIGKTVEKSEKKATPTQKAATPVAAPVVEENLMDDGELVAVIAAAIAASENTSTDSFVVRSIRRKPNNKWSRA